MSEQPFADHFSRSAADYAAHRPRYPIELFAWLAGLPARCGLTWDCGTGNGQAAVGIAGYFDRVVATDASAAQLAEAEPHPRVTYRVASAGRSGPPFFDEVRRVLAPGGVIAAWTYRGATLDEPALTHTIETFMLETMGPYWASARRFVNDGYRSIPFPFVELAAPPFTMAAAWTLDELLRYVATWSAVGRYRAEQGRDPMPALEAELLTGWGPKERRRWATWPISVRAGRAG